MARSYARINVTRYADPGWRALTLEQRGLYDFLLTHPKLSICGALDVKLSAWLAAIAGVDTERLSALLLELEAANLIRWDQDTDEVVIRTFVRHDGVLQNKNSGKGMWSAWTTIESEDLRRFLVENFEDLAFEQRFDPPISALEIRRSIGSSEPAIEQSSERSIELSVSEPQPPLDPSSAEIPARFTPRHLRSAGDNRLSGATTA